MRKIKNEELGRLSIEEYQKTDKIPLVMVLDNVRSLNNVGSVFRTCDAFLVEKIYLCGITGTPPHKDIYKTALGATESVRWEYCSQTQDVIRKLRANDYVVLSLEQVEGNISLSEYPIEKNEKYAIILGNEVKGVSQEVVDASDYSIEIPQYGTKHSLNIAVSAGIVIWRFFTALYGKQK